MPPRFVREHNQPAICGHENHEHERARLETEAAAEVSGLYLRRNSTICRVHSIYHQEMRVLLSRFYKFYPFAWSCIPTYNFGFA
jgi:hypothetical protein